jgi:hypothetical protein
MEWCGFRRTDPGTLALSRMLIRRRPIARSGLNARGGEMKIKTSELIDAPLDWAAASADGCVWATWRFKEQHAIGELNYSTDHRLGGPLLEREKIDIRHRPLPWHDVEATCRTGAPLNAFGPTGLVAGMRCFVASRLGDEVEVPDELVDAFQEATPSRADRQQG